MLFIAKDLGPDVKAVISVSCMDDQHLRRWVKIFVQSKAQTVVVVGTQNNFIESPLPRSNPQTSLSTISSGESLKDFTSLIWKPQTPENPTPEEASTPPYRVVGIGVNCVSPTDITGALQILSASVPTASPSPSQQQGQSTEHETKPVNPAAIVPALKSKLNIEAPSTVLVAYPNSGEKWDPVSRGWVPGTGLRKRGAGVEEFGRLAQEEWRAGARVLGGCCRIRPDHITELRRVLLELARSTRDPAS